MLDKKFQRTIEDFQCQHCGHEVKGTGYTNHCPNCLWSKHVDINPGDRAAECQGLMEPIGVVLKGGSYVIEHRCTKCGASKRNKTSPEDNMDAIIALSASPQT